MPHILLIEDSLADVILLQRALRGLPHRLSHTTQINKGIDLLQAQNEYDVVLLDLGLPDASGVQSVRHLRAAAPGTPVIVLTGSNTADYSAALGADVEDLLSKQDLTPPILQRTIAFAMERHRRIQHARSTADSLRLVVEANPDAMLVLDENNIIRLANPAAALLLCRPLSQLVGSPLPFHLQEGMPTTLSLGRAESPSMVEVRTAPLRWEDGMATLASMRDVTTREQTRQLQAQLAQSERLVAVGQLATGVAHEINNPATVLLANLDLLQQDLPALQDALRHDAHARGVLGEAAEMLSDSLASIQRIRRVIQDLKGFARVSKDDVDLLDLNEIVQLCCGFTRHQIRHRAQLQVDLGTIPLLMGERGGLSQVLLNLLLNASHAITKGESSENTIRVQTCADEEYIYLRVSDTGCGIAPQVLPNIFNPFFSTRTAGDGTGLGLSLSRDIVDRHLGVIAVRSAPGEGSLFEVRLPLNNNLKAVAPVQTKPPKPHSSRHRMLLIDDEPLILSALQRQLSAHYDVCTASGGREALDLLQADSAFDVLISDLMMPDISGMGLLHALEEVHPRLVERLIFCSGGAVTPAIQGFCSRTTRPILDKPVTAAEIHQAVQSLLGQLRTATHAGPKGYSALG